MKKRLAALLALLLTFTLLFAACAPGAEPFIPESAAPAQTDASPTDGFDEPEAEPPESPDANAPPEETADAEAPPETAAPIAADGVYTSKEDVALYLHTYGALPENFITKKEAKALGWSGGDLTPYAPGKCIGGSPFGNYEGQLPEKDGRRYYECDIDTLGKTSRGAKRLVYSNDGLIYYTEDHYEHFRLLYGEDLL